MRTNALIYFIGAAILTLTGCTNSNDAVVENLPDTKAFKVTHNLELSDMTVEREIASTNKQTELNAIFAQKTQYDFNYVPAGQTSPIVEFDVYSLHKDEIKISGITISGKNANEFLLLEQPDYPSSLKKESSLRAKVMFSPRNSGQKSATLFVKSENHGAFRVEMSGNGGGSPELNLALIRPEGEYPIPNQFTMRVLEPTKPLARGICSETPQKFTYQISNPVNLPLTIQTAKLEGVHNAMFQLSGAMKFPLTVAPNGKTAITVEFPGGHPEGYYQTALILESNDLNESMYTVPIKTYALAPTPCFQLAVTSKPNEVPSFQPLYKKPRLALGVIAAETSSQFAVQLKNTGFAPLQIAADKVSYVLTQKPSPISMLLQIPPTGISLAPGELLNIPLSISTTAQRVPFSAELRFALVTTSADPTAATVETVFSTTLEGVVGTPAPAQDPSNLAIKQTEAAK